MENCSEEKKSETDGILNSDGVREELEQLMLEYLKDQQLVDTWECLRSEKLAKAWRQRSRIDIAPAKERDESNEVRDITERKEDSAIRVQASNKITELLIAFEERSYGRFFALWKMFSLSSDTDTSQARKRKDLLAFKLHLLFFADKSCTSGDIGSKSVGSTRSSETRCEQLSSFLRGEGAKIASCNPELYRYFALPHVTNPESEKEFGKVYSLEWANTVETELRDLVQCLELDKGAREPRLLTIFHEHDNFRALFERELNESRETITELKSLSEKLLSACVKLLHDLSLHDRAGKGQQNKQAKAQLLQIKRQLEKL